MGERDQSRRKKVNMSARVNASKRTVDRRRSREANRPGHQLREEPRRSRVPNPMPEDPLRHRLPKEAFDVQKAPVQRAGKPVRSDGMQQIILPMGIPATAVETQQHPENTRGGKRRQLSRKEQRRRRNRRRALFFLLMVLVMVLGFFLSINVLFKVDSYRIEDFDRNDPPNIGIYTEDAIIAALNVPLGDNLFGFKLESKAAMMEKNMPYMENVVIKRRLPGTIVVRVQPAVPQYRVYGEFGWVELSQSLKVLSVQQEELTGLLELKLPVNQPLVGEKLTFRSEEENSDLQEDFDHLIALLEKESLLKGTTFIDMENEQEIAFNYQDRILVKLGTANNLDYKLRLCGVILRNDDGNCLDEKDRGTLDASYTKKDGTIEPVFRSENDIDITTSVAAPEEPEEDGAESGDEPTDAA